MAGGGFCNVTNIESMTDEDKKRCTEMTEPKDLAHPLKRAGNRKTGSESYEYKWTNEKKTDNLKENSLNWFWKVQTKR